jgi:dolichol-phosphate mannosyltransferase
MRTLVWVPVFNQVRELPAVLEGLAAQTGVDFDLLLVNNGSRDGSEKLIRDSGHAYIDVEKNQGVGHSYALAIDWAIEHGYEVLVGVAANGKMLPEEMPRLLKPVYGGEADFVRGSRFLRGGASPNLPLFRRLAIPLVNLAVFFAVFRWFTDATCGYRALRLEPLRHPGFDLHQPWLHTYSFEYYLDAKFTLDKRLKVIEVPVTMKYPAKGPHSKIRGVRDWYAMVKPWFVAAWDGKPLTRAHCPPSRTGTDPGRPDGR